MKKNSFSLILVISILVLISSACNAPILSQVLPDAGPSGDSSSAELSEVSESSSGPEMEAPHNTDGAELTLIPGATFQMGSSTVDTLADQDEFPQHQVSGDPFYLYTYEVTNQMYAACVDAGYCMRPQSQESGPSSHVEDSEYVDNPVVGVDWVMARDYCSWAGSRLPTEAEWELASRGPDSLLYPWGSELPSCDYVNMGGCLIPPDTRQVGYYLLGNSPDEVWDLSGNAWEWVHDWYADDYYAQSPADNPIGPLEPQDPDVPLRVIRGGGLNSEPIHMRSAARKGLNPYRVFTDVGFRCVAGDELVLPAAYDPGVDRHERVPPDSADGGDSAEDPDGGYFIWAGPVTGPCRLNGFGIMELQIPCGASQPPTAVATRYDFDWWDESCDYDPVAQIATCIGPDPHDYMVNPPPSFPIDLCIGTGEWAECINDLPVTKPSYCQPGPQQLSMEIHADCLDSVEARTPVIIIEFDPGISGFTHATANGILLTCSEAGENTYNCSGLPGSPGDELAVTVFFSDGATSGSTLVYPDCGTLDFGVPWVLSGRGCLLHEGSASEYYAVIDTFIDATFTSWRLDGVEAPKVCAEDPIVGRWYCNFAIRDWYTTLTFCADWVGGPGELCQTFPASQFGDLLPERCGTPGTGEISCADFTTQLECDSHPVLCMWESKMNACYPRP